MRIVFSILFASLVACGVEDAQMTSQDVDDMLREAQADLDGPTLSVDLSTQASSADLDQSRTVRA